MKNKPGISIALISISLLSMELIWTRILAAEFFYTFAFLVLSLAVLGLGMGALTLRLFPRLTQNRLLPLSLLLGGLMILAGPSLVYRLGMNFSALHSDLSMLPRLVLMILILSSSYFFCGIALTLLLKQYHPRIDRLYMADLLGAGAGVILAILAMNSLGTPAASFIMSIPVFVAATGYLKPRQNFIPLLFIILALLGTVNAEHLLRSAKPERAPVIYQHWDAMAQIKMFVYPGDEARGLVIDNAANTPVYRFDGDYGHPDSIDEATWGIPVGDLIDRFEACRFLSLGAGGGADVLQALVEGAAEVYAVEVNPWFNRLLREGDPAGYLTSYTDTLDTAFADLPAYSGHIYDNPRVTVISEDARAFIRRQPAHFDVIYSLSSNTFAALASGSFALAENYLFTTEAFRDYWTALSDSGFLMLEHQFYMPRLVTEVQQALDEMDIAEPRKHFAVYDLPKMHRKVLLLSKQLLEPDLLAIALTNITSENGQDIHLLFPAVDSLRNNDIQNIVDQGWRTWADSVAIDISPNTDNRPFAAQMGLWKNLKLDQEKRLLPYEFFGFPLTKVILLSIILVVFLFMVPLTLLPFRMTGPKLSRSQYLYFASIGFAYMAIELILMQQYTLLVGPSVYSVAAILAGLLLWSGVGSRWSGRFSARTVFLAIAVWVILDILLFNTLVEVFGTAAQGFRIATVLILLAPLGFFMGMPFPKGVGMVGDLVDWGFAVNGAASVLGSTLTLLIVLQYGFMIGLICALLGYALAYSQYRE